MGYFGNFFGGGGSSGSGSSAAITSGVGSTIAPSSYTHTVFTTQINPTATSTNDSRLADYPHSINTYAGFDSFRAAGSVIAKYNLTEDIDYIKIETGRIGLHYPSSILEVRFKDKRYISEINDEAARLYYVNSSLRQYALPDYKDFYFHALHMAKHGTLKASINFIPKVNKFDAVVQEIISFYVSNNYELPEDIGTFKSKYLTLNSTHTYYTVYVKNEEEAALLLLQISDLIDII